MNIYDELQDIDTFLANLSNDESNDEKSYKPFNINDSINENNNIIQNKENIENNDLFVHSNDTNNDLLADLDHLDKELIGYEASSTRSSLSSSHLSNNENINENNENNECINEKNDKNNDLNDLNDLELDEIEDSDTSGDNKMINKRKKSQINKNNKIKNHRRKIASIYNDLELDNNTLKAREAEKKRADGELKRFNINNNNNKFNEVIDLCEIDKDDINFGRNMETGELCLNPLADGSFPKGNNNNNNNNSLENEEPVILNINLSKNLKKHQIKGARFIWSHIDAEPQGFGCILADFMGLGKTLQVISVIHTFLKLKNNNINKEYNMISNNNSDYNNNDNKNKNNNSNNESDSSYDEEEGDDDEEEDDEFNEKQIYGFSSFFNKNKNNRIKKRYKYNYVLVLSPAICVRNWETEFNRWLSNNEINEMGSLLILESGTTKTIYERLSILREWNRKGGVLVMGYELYRLLILQSLYAKNNLKKNKKESSNLPTFRLNATEKKLVIESSTYLSNPGPDMIILDEAHRIRDEKSKLVFSLSKVRTMRRILLTGYPLQNHLREYFTMVNFARPNYLGTKEEFKNRFEDPIKNGQCLDSNANDVKLARQRAYVLTQELKPFVLRRDQKFLYEQLPEKQEWILLCKLTPLQNRLYHAFLQDKQQQFIRDNKSFSSILPSKKNDVLAGYHTSLSISNHPDVLYYTICQLNEDFGNSTNTSKDDNNKKKRSIMNKSIKIVDSDDNSDNDGSEYENEEDLFPYSNHNEENKIIEQDIPSHRLQFAENLLLNHPLGNLQLSGKMVILFDLLYEFISIGDKVTIFSQSIATLDLIGKLLDNQNKKNHNYKTNKNNKMIYNYVRIDGSTPTEDRFKMIKKFNEQNNNVNIILISTKAGGEGINLCGGNRIVIFDVCWNPCHDSQSMCRSYRFGQKKKVYVYRLISNSTMEKKVYDLQISKEQLSKRIIDDKFIEKKFYLKDLSDYFNVNHFIKMQKDNIIDYSDQINPNLNNNGSIDHHNDNNNDDNNDIVILDNNNNNVNKTDKKNIDINKDIALYNVIKKNAKCLYDYYEQERMFEEDLAEMCPKEEQEIALNEYHDRKVMSNASFKELSSNSNNKRISCPKCRQVNVFASPSSDNHNLLKERFITCDRCRAPIDTTDAKPFILNNYQSINKNSINNTLPMPTTFVGKDGKTYRIPPMLAPFTTPLLPNTTIPSTLPYNFLFNNSTMTNTPLISSTYPSLTSNSNLNSTPESMPTIQEQNDSLNELNNINNKIKNKHILLIRRGIGVNCSIIEKKAKELGAIFDVELNDQTNLIISKLNKEKVLKKLNISSIPPNILFYDISWLETILFPPVNQVVTANSDSNNNMNTVNKDNNNKNSNNTIDISDSDEEEDIEDIENNNDNDNDINDLLSEDGMDEEEEAEGIEDFFEIIEKN